MPERGFHSMERAQRWEEALLCGNGKTGVLVMGNPFDETLIISHERLFLPWNPAIPPVDTASHLNEIREMLSRREYQRAADFVVDLAKVEGYESKRWTDSFFPAADICIHIDGCGVAEEYRRTLDFTNGLATVQYHDKSRNYTQQVFVSRHNGVTVVKISTNKPSELSCSISICRHPRDEQNDYWQGQEKFDSGLGENVTRAEGDKVFFRSCFQRDKSGYECMAKVAHTGGKLTAHGDRILVDGSDEVVITFSLALIEDMRKTSYYQLRDVLDSLNFGFDALLALHKGIHGEIFSRVSLQLGNPEEEELTSEALLLRSLGALPELRFIQTAFDAGRYAILSSSGDLPPNLQGVWTGFYGVPWSSDYTNNGNVQTAVSGSLCCNMLECMDSFLRYMERLMPDCRENAHRLYNCGGLLMASRTSTHGLNNHFDGTWPMTFWTAGAAWNARFFYDYWLYTGNYEFFVTRALPYMLETAQFYQDFLIEDDRGFWFFSPSYSPENHAANTNSQACVNATMDIAVVRELFSNLIEGCQTLGLEQERIPGWKAMLSKMPPYDNNSDGAVKEWCDLGLEDRYDHRHASHLYPLFYSMTKDIKNNSNLYDAFKIAYEKRLNVRADEANVMAFGYVQLGQVAARLGDAETLEKIINLLCSGYHFKTFATAHNKGPEIFNVDLSGGIQTLVMEALVQSDTIADASGGISRFEIKLLPALPLGWECGELHGALTRGGFIVDLAWNRSALKTAVIMNPQRRRCDVYYQGRVIALQGFDQVALTAADFEQV